MHAAFFSPLPEQCDDSGSANAHKHFHKIRSGDGEKRDASLARDNPRQRPYRYPEAQSAFRPWEYSPCPASGTFWLFLNSIISCNSSALHAGHILQRLLSSAPVVAGAWLLPKLSGLLPPLHLASTRNQNASNRMKGRVFAPAAGTSTELVFLISTLTPLCWSWSQQCRIL